METQINNYQAFIKTSGNELFIKVHDLITTKGDKNGQFECE